MKRHILVSTQTEASHETSRWRDPGADYKFAKQTGHQERIDKAVHKANLVLTKRMYDVVTEDRVNRTTEYAPGWRTGLCACLYPHSLLVLSQIMMFQLAR